MKRAQTKYVIFRAKEEEGYKLDGNILWLEKFPLIGNFITNGKISIPQDMQ